MEPLECFLWYLLGHLLASVSASTYDYWHMTILLSFSRWGYTSTAYSKLMCLHEGIYIVAPDYACSILQPQNLGHRWPG